MSNETDTTEQTQSEAETSSSTEETATKTTEASLLSSDADGGESPKTETDGKAAETAETAETAEPEFNITPIELDALKSELPENLELSDESLTEFTEIVNSAGSREAMAKDLISFYEKLETAAVTGMVDEWNNTQADWRKTVREDAEIGGAALNQNLAQVKTLVENYANDPVALKELFTSTGAGNNIEMVKFLLAISKAIPSEATPVTGQQTSTPKSIADRMFPTTAQTN